MIERPLPDAGRAEARRLLVAGRGRGYRDGLHRWTLNGAFWHGRHLATVVELSALASHPSIPVVYGSSDAGDRGRVYAWDISGDHARLLSATGSGGADPCHVAVEPDGGTLVVLNHASGSIGVQRLADDGSFEGELHVVNLVGTSVDSDRQEGPHPHQAIFHRDRLYVVDLGADLLREYDVEPHGDAAHTLSRARETALPAGTGPRHAAVLPDGRFAISGELASTVIIGRPGSDVDSWVIAPSTKRTGPAKTRHPRNYPGDIQASADGRMIYVANRGYDTITTYAVSGAEPRFISEVDAGVAWPQHLLVADGELLVAGWDSSRVMVMPLVKGEPGKAHVLFECPGAAWLMTEAHSIPE